MRAQDPLKPPPAVINSDAKPEEVLPQPVAAQPNPSEARPPHMGAATTESDVEAAEIEARIEAKRAKEEFDRVTPEPLWRRLGIVLPVLAGALLLALLVGVRGLRRKRDGL